MKAFYQRDYRDTHPKLGKQMLAWLCAIAVFVAIFGYFSPKAKASLVCHGELSIGAGASSTELSDGGDKIDLAQKGILGGVGGGCDVVKSDHLFGVMLRYSALEIEGALGDESLKSKGLFEIAARLGLRLTDKATLYAKAGWAWMKLDIATLDKSPSGMLLGGGIEHQIGATAWSIRGEYSYYHFQSESVMGAGIQPDMHVARAALVYSFGGPEEAKAAPVAKKKLAP